MSIELAEKLKQKLTDKWVVVDPSVPELRRFANWTGKVKTVNMNCRALVEFDGGVDIGWYDIDPAFLTVVDGPRPKAEAAPAAKGAPAPAKEAKPAAALAGKSPLEAARSQGAAKPAAAAAAPPSGKPSPLDLIRKQGAAKREQAAASATEPVQASSPPSTAPEAAPETPAPPATASPTPAVSEGRKLSPLELARLQGAAKRPG
uniref:Uncharacterized protein n=1 Tax=Schlesneria paludicola TaxID=360056 RepID=A0A7C4QQA0_9PLAN